MGRFRIMIKKLLIGMIVSLVALPLLVSLSFLLMFAKGDGAISENNLTAGKITINGNYALPFSEGTYTISRGITGSHYGVDFVAEYGTAIVALCDAEVYQISNYCQPNGGYLGNWCPFDNVAGGGNYVVLRFKYEDLYYYVQYAHMSQVTVSKGDKVKQGEVIGAIGHSGNSTGTHLHMEIHTDGIYAGSKLNLVDAEQLLGLKK